MDWVSSIENVAEVKFTHQEDVKKVWTSHQFCCSAGLIVVRAAGVFMYLTICAPCRWCAVMLTINWANILDLMQDSNAWHWSYGSTELSKISSDMWNEKEYHRQAAIVVSDYYAPHLTHVKLAKLPKEICSCPSIVQEPVFLDRICITQLDIDRCNHVAPSLTWPPCKQSNNATMKRRQQLTCKVIHLTLIVRTGSDVSIGTGLCQACNRPLHFKVKAAPEPSILVKKHEYFRTIRNEVW